HERRQDQPLEDDLDLACDLSTAGASDDLDDTVDYGAVCDLVVATLRREHVALLETAATRVADAVLRAEARVLAVDVAVRKLRPPVPHQLATSGVRIERRREQ